MKFIQDWLTRCFPRHRLIPTAEAGRNEDMDHLLIPDSLIELWIERTQFNNPQSTDPYVCVAWAARCDFVESIVKIRDRAAFPGKYPIMEQAPVIGKFDPRKVA
jgi:hypothetical protein